MDFDNMFLYIIKNINKGYSITEEDICAVQQKYDIVFPYALKSFYLHFNGASIKEIYVKGRCNEKLGIHNIYPLKYKWKYGSNNLLEPDASSLGQLEWAIELSHEYDSVKCNNLIPFADDVGGDEYYWQIETEYVYLIRFDDIEHPILVFDSIYSFFESFSNIGKQLP